jgi:hypothetical protein
MGGIRPLAIGVRRLSRFQHEPAFAAYSGAIVTVIAFRPSTSKEPSGVRQVGAAISRLISSCPWSFFDELMQLCGFVIGTATVPVNVTRWA